MRTFLRDLRHGARALFARPGFALAAMATLAIGIGAQTAIFSVVYGVLLRPLPFPDSDRIVDVAELDGRGRPMRVADANYRDFAERSRSLDALSAYSAGESVVTTPAEALRLGTGRVTGRFFEALGVRPAAGRAFSASERAPGGPPVAVVSDGFWRAHMDARAHFGSMPVKVDGIVHTVIGVLPPGAGFPEHVEIWTARERLPFLPSRTAHNNRLLARLAPGASISQARTELSAIARRIGAEHRGEPGILTDASVTPLRDILTGKVRKALLLLLAAALALFFVACIDVIGLLLARASARRREIAVRRALGAGRIDIIRTFLAESIAVVLPGGFLGVAIAGGIVGALRRMAPADLPRAEAVAVDGPVLVAALALALLAAVSLAIATGSSQFGARVAEVLRGHLATGDRSSRRVQRALSTGQLAVTALLLCGLTLMGRSFLKLMDVPMGFEPAHVLAVDLAMPAARSDADMRDRRAFIGAILDRFSRIPGVTEAGATSDLPLSADFSNGTFLRMSPGQQIADPSAFETLFRDPSRTGDADYALATGDYFRAMGIPLVRGRGFDARDTPEAAPVAVISETLARRSWPGEDPIGRRVEFGNMDGDLRPMTVVGVVADVRPRRLEDPPEPIIYGSLMQRYKEPGVTLALRTSGNPAAVAPLARRLAREIDPRIPVTTRTMEEVIASSVASRRLGILLLSFFSAAAFALACTGLAGITAYATAQRRREMGIRAALGARPAALLRLLVLDQAKVVAIGLAAGIGAALVLGGFARGLLFGVAASDPAAIATTSALLAAGAFVAVTIPALRILGLHAAEVLRSE